MYIHKKPLLIYEVDTLNVACLSTKVFVIQYYNR